MVLVYFLENRIDLKSKILIFKDSGLKLLYIKGSILFSLLLVSDPYLDIYKFQSESTRGAKSVLIKQIKRVEVQVGLMLHSAFSSKGNDIFYLSILFWLQNTQDLEKELTGDICLLIYTLLGYNCYFIGHFRSIA